MEGKIDKVVKLLGMLQVTGYDNCAIIVASINELNQLKREVISNGTANS